MKQNKKIAITHYISIRFSAIIFIMAAIMILFISYFSNKTIYFSILYINIEKIIVCFFPDLPSDVKINGFI